MLAILTKPQSDSLNQQVNCEADDSGINVSSRQEPSAVSVVSSPAHSTVTPPTLPPESEVSTVSSSLVFQGFSSLWIQLLISKLIVNVYNRQMSSTAAAAHDKSSKCTTPITSPAAPDRDAHQLNGGPSLSNEALEMVNISLEADGISLQVDIQERCTDLIFKMALMECSYLKKKSCQDDKDISWRPYLSNSNGKLFSTVSSSLPEELSRMTDPLSHQLVPCEQVMSSDGPSGVGYLLSPQHQLSPKLQPNFIQLKLKLPQSQPLKTVKLSLSVKPFEVVAWLPVLDTMLEIFSAAATTKQTGDVKVHVYRIGSFTL